ncbi:MAG: restriction endonuclease [Acidobacteriia bacterium]|nr:restriction endonuclease [Terriglobia bacterium]
MADEFNLRDVEPVVDAVVTAAQIARGIPIPAVSRLATMSADEWEQFTEEWSTYLKNQGEYCRVRRSAGSGDRGLDIVAFTSERGFADPWDSFQCKHYSRVLGPRDVCIEVVKLIYHSFNRTIPFNQACRVPRRHVFISPKGAGLTVHRWLEDKDEFKRDFKNRWEQCCVTALGKHVPLAGNLLAYVEAFDFGIFDDRSGIELVEQHAETRFHTARFGGGLPPRERTPRPPATPTDEESVYIRKLLDAYEDHLGKAIETDADLSEVPEIRQHYNRQREMFYSAESLRNFARDRTPEGTYGSFREEIYDGVVDLYEQEHDSGFERVRATVGRAAIIGIEGNALAGVARVKDKQGACHQLANDCVLTWVGDAEQE